MSDTDRTERIRTLNDALRSYPWNGPRALGRTLLTAGVNGKGPAFVLRALNEVAGFNGFSADNDPYGEHDFGSFELDGTKLFWKIDLYQKGSDFTAGAEEPDNPEVTDRVLTIMLAEDY